MTIDRRQLMAGGLLAGGAGMAGAAGAAAVGAGLSAGLVAGGAPIDAAQAAPGVAGGPISLADLGVRPDDSKDQSKGLQKAIDAAARAGRALYLPPGTYQAAGLVLPGGSRLLGEPGRSVLRFAGGQGLLVARGRAGGAGDQGVALWGLVLDGAGRPFTDPQEGALFRAQEVSRLDLARCRIRNSTGSGVSLLRCSGRVTALEISQCATAGIFSLDARALEISHNHVHHIGNNGIQVWQTAPRRDGTLIAQNLVHDIRSQEGGSGQNGNGINVFRADDVVITGNRVANCAFSAIRANASSNCQILGNACHKLGETAIYAEFKSVGCIISSNLIDGAQSGIHVTNFDHGGRLAVVQGNLVRHITGAKSEGIGVEAHTSITGNVIEEAANLGLGIGWSWASREVIATGNLIRKAKIGIGISAHKKAGYIFVANNFISGAKKGGIRAMDHDRPLGPDLAQNGAEAFRNFALYGNVSI